MSIAKFAAGSRPLACLAAAAVVLAAPRVRAQADDAAVVDKVTKLNKKAVEEYENLNFEDARKLLKEALDLCSQSGLDKHPIKARTHIHLGVVILEGFKQKDLALKQFRKALEIQPDIKLTKTLANPEVQEAFDEAAAAPTGKPEGGKPEEAEKPPEKPAEAEKPTGPFEHQPVTTAVQGKPIVIKATTDGSIGAKKMVLGYRAASSGDFLGREMKEVSPGRWTAEIPASATNGDRVDYYVDAQGEDGDSVASKGTADDPLVIALRGAGAPEEDDGEEDEDDGTTRRWFISLAVGSGIGWATGSGEVNATREISPAGFAPAGLGHVSPEVGYFVRPQLLVSVQLRYQYVTGPTPEKAPPGIDDCGTDGICSPAKYSVAGFAKATWLLRTGRFRPYVVGAIGGGYIRHVAEFPSVGPVCGNPPDDNKVCVDTVAAGPVLLGPGAGFFYNVTPAFALSLAANSYLGFPTFTFHVDINGGVAVAF